MKHLKYILPAMTMVLAASCSEWDDHYNNADQNVENGATLWEQMQQHTELSDFCQVLQHTYVFRHHKKTSVSYADLLGQGQAFTVIAPTNGTFNKDSLIALTQTNEGDSLVEKTFVNNQIARSNWSDVATAQKVMLMNTKNITLGTNKAEGISLTQSNLRAKNGILHIAAQRLPFYYNLYEAMTGMPQFSKIGNFFKSYDEDYFDESSSVSSGIKDGVKVYVDSVIIQRNLLLNRIGLLKAEDSTYWMIAPSDAGYAKAYAAAEASYKFASTVNKGDSLQRYFANKALIQDGIYNMNQQKSLKDSILSVQYNRYDPWFHVFYQPDQTLFSKATKVKCSNGMLYQTDEWPFTPEQTYFQLMKTEAEYINYITEYSKGSYNTRHQAADSISEDGYLDIVPETSKSNWSMTFRLDDVLSNYYDVCVVILPQNVTGIADYNKKPNQFTATITYLDEKGNVTSYDCGGTKFNNDPLRVDTVVLAKAFKFPTTNYSITQATNKFALTLTCAIGTQTSQNNKYNREMYLDCIYLRPAKKE